MENIELMQTKKLDTVLNSNTQLMKYLEIVSIILNKITIMDRRLRQQTVKKCFTGRDFVDFLHKERIEMNTQ